MMRRLQKGCSFFEKIFSGLLEHTQCLDLIKIVGNILEMFYTCKKHIEEKSFLPLNQHLKLYFLNVCIWA